MFNSSRGSFIQNIPPVTRNLIIINVIVWLFMCMASYNINNWIEANLALHYVKAPDFNAAQFITYMFIHATDSLGHIFLNMFMLLMFGCIIERTLGSKRFLFYYISCGVGAALIQQIIWGLTMEHTLATMFHIPVEQIEQEIMQIERMGLPHTYLNAFATIGASGAIYGVLLAFAMIYPNMPMYFMFIPVPIKAKWMVLGSTVIELLVGMSNANDGVAHFAHLGGIIFGCLIILYWKKKGIINGRHFY